MGIFSEVETGIGNAPVADVQEALPGLHIDISISSCVSEGLLLHEKTRDSNENCRIMDWRNFENSQLLRYHRALQARIQVVWLYHHH
jgi:hypothetical protein